jgi:pyridoxal phosphate enzyme (YggS family)
VIPEARPRPSLAPVTDAATGTGLEVDVAGNLTRVRADVDAACVEAGRDPSDVRLLPVSKTHPNAVLEAAYAAGVRLFGENKVQEAAEKADHFADRPDVRWAMIGHLQSNKVRLVAAFADELHALDSLKVARGLHRALHELDRTLDVFVQVNSSDEPQKSGLAPADVEGLLTELTSLSTLRVRGLMTLALNSDDEAAVAACFVRTAALRDALPPELLGRELSMGMSGDFALAIAHGATTVRVGQAIFGAREA